MFSHRGVFNLHTAVNNKQPLSVAMETPEWVFGTIIEQQNTSFYSQQYKRTQISM
jgi:hypothetical protein